MSRKRGVKQPSFVQFICAWFLLWSVQGINANGNIGCLYSKELCNINSEWCFNDNAFGKCVPKSDFMLDDLYRYEFKYGDLEKLKDELEELQELGYSWQHPYTQCIIQNQLTSIKYGILYNGEICEEMLKKRTTNRVQALPYERRLPMADQPKIWNIRNLIEPNVNEGIIKYEPDDEVDSHQFDGKADYSNTQNDYERELNQLRMQSRIKSDIYKTPTKFTSSRYRGTPLYIPIQNRNKFKINDDDSFDDKKILDGNLENNWDILKNDRRNMYGDILNTLKDEKTKAYAEGGSVFISDKRNDYEDFDQYDSDIFGFQRRERLDVKKPGPYFKVNNYAFKNMNAKNEENDFKQELEDNIPKMQSSRRNVERSPKELNLEYEYVPNYGLNHGHSSVSQTTQNDNSSFVTIETNNQKQNFDTYKVEYTSSFELSHHRVTHSAVQQFIGSLTKFYNLPSGVFKSTRSSGNRIILFVGPNIGNYTAVNVKELIESSFKKNMIKEIDLKNIYIGQPNVESTLRNVRPFTDSDKLVDADYTYIQLKNRIKNFPEVENILNEIASLLKLPRLALHDIKTGVSDIAFKIGPNKENMTASEAAKKIDSHKKQLEDKLHIDISSIGIGDKDKFPVAVPIDEQDNKLYAVTFITCGIIAAVFVSSVALYFLRKQSKLKDKLPVPHEKKEICINKMPGKFIQEGSPAGRITSISKESDNSPSSRSSTSSWSEEPMTNMDITTGHMVLAYMEDHLTNKARLDTEWAALCAYDADPCSVAIAQSPENMRKNRYVNALPYDHARVVLNALSNVNGSDYINASTITDHDPRNAAYIASQGTLENTICDFWQMIWEQGCVVIVMLTRLVENDTSMCHRYWPLEGAELYNIYEVHLVSEHIWCDDFLVRSFYLKNLKTTETRTVTQFHFLTWPEGGIPSATKPLLEFRRKVNKSFRGRSCPIVVHCSDGVGRTGSYLLLDMVLNRISKGAKEIDIAATLEHIRDQRAGAVCTKQQFQFVLSAVAEEVQAVLRALPQQQQTTQESGSDSGLSAGQSASSAQQELVATTSGVTTISGSSSQASGEVLNGQSSRKQSK